MNTFKEEYSVNNKHESDKTKRIQESLLRKQLGAGGVVGGVLVSHAGNASPCPTKAK